MKEIVISVVVAMAVCGCRGGPLFEPERFHFEVVRTWALETGELARHFEPELVCVAPERPICYCDPSDRDRRDDIVGGLDPSQRLDLSTASLDDLQELPGIGPTLARRIIDFRKTGRLRRSDDLLGIDGIGRTRFRRLAPLVTVR